ncbi:ATP-binding protein [Streptomyces mirabilis]
MRKAAPDVLATARAQRWDPAEVLRLLIAEEVTGRDAATRRLRRHSANFPTGKILASWRAEDSTIPEPTQNSLVTLEWIGRADLIVVDGIGLLPVGEDAAEAFYRIIDAAYERRSIAVTSNIHPSGFDTIMPETLAGASTDRLMHRAHLVTTTGDSHRLAEALAGKGVIPLH